ncbi:MAG: hypothetical protein OEV44_09415 [Spirochaetota bacterium]|nr:hypothetical protein [Spirochaetota bacterium]
MFKRILLLSLVFLFASQYSFSKTKTFNDHGITLEYPANYNINSGTAPQGYKFVYLKSPGSNISIQIFPLAISDSLRGTYLKSFEGTLKKGGATLSDTNQTKRRITINDSTVKGGTIRVDAVAYRTTFSNDKGNKGKTQIFFFSYREKGYVVAFTHNAAINRNKDFKVVVRSFTILPGK